MDIDTDRSLTKWATAEIREVNWAFLHTFIRRKHRSVSDACSLQADGRAPQTRWNIGKFHGSYPYKCGTSKHETNTAVHALYYHFATTQIQNMCSQTTIQRRPHLAIMKVCEQKFRTVPYFDLPPLSINQHKLRWINTDATSGYDLRVLRKIIDHSETTKNVRITSSSRTTDCYVENSDCERRKIAKCEEPKNERCWNRAVSYLVTWDCHHLLFFHNAPSSVTHFNGDETLAHFA